MLTEPEVKEAAEEIARDTDGVRRVLNHLKGPFRLMHLATRKATGRPYAAGIRLVEESACPTTTVDSERWKSRSSKWRLR